MDCLDPPIEEPPKGHWHCPLCPPLDPNFMFHPNPDEEQLEDVQQEFPEEPIPSSSKSDIYPTKSPAKGKGKAPPIPTDNSDRETDVPVVKSRKKGKLYKKGKTKGKARITTEDEEEPKELEENGQDDDDLSPVRPAKRMKIRINSPAPRLPRIRLRIPPQKGKGKEREDDEPSKGLFDDILSVTDRDTSKTVILNTDKFQFERSRLAAEVSALIQLSLCTVTYRYA